MKRRTLVRTLALLLIILAGAGVLVATARHADNAVIATMTFDGAYPFAPAVDTRTGRMFVLAVAGNPRSPHSELRMLDTATGALLRTLPLAYSAFSFDSTPVIDERTERVIVTANSRVFLFDSRTGAPRAIARASAQLNQLTLDATADRLYASSNGFGWSCSGGGPTLTPTTSTCALSDATVGILSARTGRVLRTLDLPQQGMTLLSIADRARRLVVAGGGPDSMPGTISIFNATTDRLLRSTPLTQGVPTYGRPPVIDDEANRAYLVLERGAGSGWFGATGPAPATRPTYTIAILDTRTGRLTRTMNLGKSMPTPVVAVDARRLYIADAGPWRSVNISGGTGSRKFHYSVPSPLSSGRLYIRDARTGALLHAVTVAPGPSAIALDTRGGRAYVLGRGIVDPATNIAGPGTVSVVDIRSARVVRTIAVGSNAQSLLLDPAARRLLVMRAGSYLPVSPPDSWGWLPRWLRRRLAFLPQGAPPRLLSPGLTILDTSRL